MLLNQDTKSRLVYYCFLACFLFIAYLPLSGFLFALKNDALTANFPNKYFFSAALEAGQLPVWNPYINFGFPLYADPGFAFWNPITWVFGLIGYNVYTLSIEVLLYIWLGSVFAFDLGRWLGHSKKVSFLIGIMYMCCGFYIGNLQHINFLTCAAFLPLVVRTFLDLQRSFNWKKLFVCLVGLYLMATGGHPAIPFACIYFLFFIQIGLFLFISPPGKKVHFILRSIRTDLILFALFLILAAPLLYSYSEIYPFFSRAAAIVQKNHLDTGFDPSSYLSFLFPFATTADHLLFKNDVSMRNGYFSLIGLICFLLVLVRKKNSYQKIFLLAGSAMLLLSAGGYLKEVLYSHLPLLDHIRTNGEFRVFGILSFIIGGASVLEELVEGRGLSIFRRILAILGGVCFLLFFSYLVHTSAKPFHLTGSIDPANSMSRSFKYWLDSQGFFDRLSLNALVLLGFIIIYFLSIKKMNNAKLLCVFIMVDLISFNWMNLPVTGVQVKSPSAIQHYFSEVKAGIPMPELTPIDENKYPGEDVRKIIGCWSYYSKQPGTPYRCDYPSMLNSTVSYFGSNLPDSLIKRPFVFLKEGNGKDVVRLKIFSSSEIEIHTENSRPDSLIILQNYYYNWKAMINGRRVPIQRTGITFMEISLQKGSNNVIFMYNTVMVKLLILFLGFTWILFFLFAYCGMRINRTNNFKCIFYFDNSGESKGRK